jgi:hypothetical protein
MHLRLVGIYCECNTSGEGSCLCASLSEITPTIIYLLSVVVCLSLLSLSVCCCDAVVCAFCFLATSGRVVLLLYYLFFAL